MSLPSINFLHLTVSEIQPGQTFSRCPPTHPDTMGENNTPTALKGCGVKMAPTANAHSKPTWVHRKFGGFQWALSYSLDRTKDLRGSRSLLFISSKKGHTSDIRPLTLSSWLTQTIPLCFKQADQQSLIQVKVHDIRVFYSGILVDQIMQACQWKAHNTFTNVYLKDLTWSDNANNMYLGPVVGAQQVLGCQVNVIFKRRACFHLW